MIYPGGEPGAELSLQCEWDQKRNAEDMRRLSGEPFQIYRPGVGWIDAPEDWDRADVIEG